MTREFDALLAAEGLAPLDDGRRMTGVSTLGWCGTVRSGAKHTGIVGPKGRAPSGRPPHVLSLDHARNALVVSAVWDWSARHDHLLAASHRAPMNATNRRICAMAGEGATWDAIAAKLGVGKHRVQRVLKAAMRWKDVE